MGDGRDLGIEVGDGATGALPRGRNRGTGARGGATEWKNATAELLIERGFGSRGKRASPFTRRKQHDAVKYFGLRSTGRVKTGGRRSTA